MNDPKRSSPWEFAVEIFPADWRCPAGPFWIAGWIDGGSQHVTDVRTWLDQKVFLGLCSLPRPDIERARHGRAGPPFLGFSFLLEPFRGARELRLEVCDQVGQWHLLTRQPITVDPAAPAPRLRPELSRRFGPLILRVLQQHKNRQTESWARSADEVVTSELAKPLDTLPNPPFYGKLEEPTAIGRIKYGRLAITGWLAHQDRAILRLIAIVDPLQPTPLLHGLPRHDMTGLFADLTEAENSQFIGHVDIPSTLPHPVALRIFAELDDGRLELVFTRRFRPAVVTGAATALPRYSFRLLLQATWSVWRAGRRRGCMMGSWDELLQAFRATREAFRAEAPFPHPTPRLHSPGATPSTRSPLKILLVTHNLNFEGAPLFALEYARYLAAQPGWSVRVISPQEGPLRGAFAAIGLTVEIVNVESVLLAETAEEFKAAVGWLAQKPVWQEADVIVTNTMVAFWAVQVARLLHKPALFYIHESAAVRRYFSPTLSPAVLRQVEDAFGWAQSTVFIASASFAVHARYQRGGNFRWLPSWIDATGLAEFAQQHSAAELRARHGLPADACVVVNVGSVCERKGQHIFIRAIERLKALQTDSASWSRFHFLMVGGRAGPYLDSLRHEIDLFGLTNVRIVEEVPDARAYYRMADLFVCSSFEESFPRVLMEAAAFKLPIVSTQVDGVGEMLTPEDAWLVPPGDATQMAMAMDAALKAIRAGDPTRAERAHEIIRTRFDAARVLPLHAALLESTVEAFRKA